MVDNIDIVGLDKMRDEILTLLGLARVPNPGKQPTPHALSLASAGNHTVSLPLITTCLNLTNINVIISIVISTHNTYIIFQQSIFMREIYKSLTEQNGAGVLKPLLSEPDLEKLRQNPFHITGNNIQVTYTKQKYFIPK